MKKLFIIFLLFTSLNSFGQTDSLDFKIAQMLLVGVENRGPVPSDNLLAEISSGRVGGVILFEKNIPANDSYVQLKQLITTLKNASPVPLFVAIDQEGGKVNRLKTKYGFPKSVSAGYLGSLNNPDSTKFYAEITAATLAGLGINVNFAPDVDVAINPDNPIIAKVERSYSANADSVALHAAEVIDAHKRFDILTVLKHFPGHGSSHADTHLGMADVTEHWKPEELRPYQHLIDSGKVEAIMTAHIVNKNLDEFGFPGTLSKQIVTNLLREKLSYNGLVFSDDMQMHAITKHYGLEASIELAINAGVDVLIFSNNISGSESRTVTTVHNIIKNLITQGKISSERIDQSYRRIMEVKSKWQ